NTMRCNVVPRTFPNRSGPTFLIIGGTRSNTAQEPTHGPGENTPGLSHPAPPGPETAADPPGAPGYDQPHRLVAGRTPARLGFRGPHGGTLGPGNRGVVPAVGRACRLGVRRRLVP